jgi:hypothetical protein
MLSVVGSGHSIRIGTTKTQIGSNVAVAQHIASKALAGCPIKPRQTSRLLFGGFESLFFLAEELKSHFLVRDKQATSCLIGSDERPECRQKAMVMLFGTTDCSRQQ